MLTTLREALTKTNFVSKIPLPPGEPIPGETYIADGWKYRDFAGRMTAEVYAEFIRLVGAENMQIMAFSHGASDGFIWARGQFLVSPEGQRRIEEYLNENP